MVFSKNKKQIFENLGAVFSAIFWAISGLSLTFFATLYSGVETNMGTNGALKFGIITAFFIELFTLCWSFLLVPIIKKNFNLAILFPFKNKRIWILILSSFLGAPLGTAMYWMAMIEIGASKATSISTLFPILSTMCVYLFMKKKSSWNTIVGLLIAVAAAVSFGIIAGWKDPNSWKGYLFISIAVVAWGLEAFLSSVSLESNVDPYVSIFLRSLTSVIVFLVILLPSFGAYSKSGIVYFSTETKKCFFFLVIAGFFACISFMLYYRALSQLSVPKATSINITYSFWTMLIEPMLLIIDPKWKLHPWYIYVLGITILLGAIFGLLDFSNFKKNKQLQSNSPDADEQDKELKSEQIQSQ
ncbi:DMT family transporter [Mycoplasmopsis hyopharyngis]|uniref:DMT family transporter n=1 Tax=Mycoplasmopsis hyopharyngis TaxID=29558 RepID=UPI003872E75D